MGVVVRNRVPCFGAGRVLACVSILTSALLGCSSHIETRAGDAIAPRKHTGADGGNVDGGNGELGAGGNSGVRGDAGTGGFGLGIGGEQSTWPLGTEILAGADAGSSATDACPTVDTPPTDVAALRVYELAQAQLHADFHRAVGQYACGDLPIYRGTFAAQDNEGATGTGSDESFTSGPVIATIQGPTDGLEFLTCTDRAMGGRNLIVIATAQQRAVQLIQLESGGGTTYSSLIRTPNTSWSGVSGVCSGCVADFFTGTPATIDVASATFQGQYCVGSTPLVVTASGHLSLVASPSFTDILEISQPFGDFSDSFPTFTENGSEMVATMSENLAEELPAVPSCFGREELVTPFLVDWYVNRQNTKLRGIRNFRIQQAFTACREFSGPPPPK